MLVKSVKSNHSVSSILVGTIVPILLTIVSAGVIAIMIINETIPENASGYYSAGMQFLSCLIGFIIAGKMSEKRLAVSVGICAAVYLVVMTGIGILLLDSSFSVKWISIIAVLISYVLACAICIRKGKSKRIRKRASW